MFIYSYLRVVSTFTNSYRLEKSISYYQLLLKKCNVSRIKFINRANTVSLSALHMYDTAQNFYYPAKKLSYLIKSNLGRNNFEVPAKEHRANFKEQ